MHIYIYIRISNISILCIVPILMDAPRRESACRMTFWSAASGGSAADWSARGRSADKLLQ